MIRVVELLLGVPAPLVRTWGTSNICKPPMRAVMMVYTSTGISRGRVTRKKTCRELAPSRLAASKRFWSMPIMPAISRMVVLPNHMRKFMVATRPRTVICLSKKGIASSIQPS